MRTLLFTSAMLTLSAAPGEAKETAPEISGYVQPSLAARYRPQAVPENQREFGLDESKAGLRIRGETNTRWGYNMYLYLTGEALQVLTHAIALDTDNDGDAEKVYTRSTSAARNLLREAWATWSQSESLNFRFGRMPIPFTSQAQAPDTELMFPNRASPNSVFLEGRDLGGLGRLDLNDGVFQIQAGLFNGTGQALGTSSEEGILYALRFDFNPLGGFDHGETGRKDEPFRFGFGAGVVAHPYTLYDSAGYPTTGVLDFRGTASFRLSGLGFHLLTEALAHYKTDTITDRPEMALGAFGQMGWCSPGGIEPVVRLGWVAEDQTFAPRHVYWGEAGLNFYITGATETENPVRLGLHYTGELRLTEREIAHGASAQALVRF